MTNAAQRNRAYRALDIAFENNEITVREYRMQEAEIEKRWPVK